MNFTRDLKILKNFTRKTINLNGKIISVKTLIKYIEDAQKIFGSGKNHKINLSTPIPEGMVRPGWDIVQDEIQKRSDSTSGSIMLSNNFTYHRTLSHNTGHDNGYWDKNYADAGYSISDATLDGASLSDNDLGKHFIFDFAGSSYKDIQNADGVLYFSPSLLSTYNNGKYHSKQLMVHSYTQKTINWNTNSNFYKNIFSKWINNNTSLYATIMPSIFSNCLTQASDYTENTGYYSYGDGANVSSNNSLGSFNIRIKGITNTYPDGKSPSWITGSNTFSLIVYMDKGDNDSRVNLNGGLPIWHSEKSPDGKTYWVWSANKPGDHENDIAIPFKVSNVDKGIMKIKDNMQ